MPLNTSYIYKTKTVLRFVKERVQPLLFQGGYVLLSFSL